MAVTPTYPSGILPWTNRIDMVNTVFANDPNTLAAEVIAIENTLGTNPQIEAAPPVGTQVTYKNVSARIHDVQLGNQIPVISLYNYAFNVKKNSMTNPYRNTYNVILDDFGFFNGQDITIRTTGWYIVTVQQSSNWASSGYFQVQLMLNGKETGRTRWSWSNPENKPGQPGFNYNDAVQNFAWQGNLNAGDQLSVESVNMTSNAVAKASSAYLRACFVRTLPGSKSGLT